MTRAGNGRRGGSRRRAAIALLALAASTPGIAGEPGEGWGNERGFSLGLQFQTDLIGAEDPASDSRPDEIFFDEVGQGGSLILGYTFTPAFTLRLSAGTARHETNRPDLEAFHGVTLLEAHWRFYPRERARPYIFGGIGGAVFRVDSAEYDSEISGGVGALGGGFLYSLTRHLVVDLGVRLDLVNWNQTTIRWEVDGGTFEISQPVDEDGSGGKFHLGLVWEF